MKVSSVGEEKKGKTVCSPQRFSTIDFSMGFRASRDLGFYHRVSVLKAMKAKSYRKFSVHSASQDRLFQGLVTDFEVRLTQNPSPHCSAQHPHVSHISEPQLLGL